MSSVKFKFAVGEDPQMGTLMSGRIFDSYVVEVTGTTKEELDAAHDDWIAAYMKAVGSTGDAYNYDIQWKDMGNGLFEGHFFTTKDYTSTKKQAGFGATFANAVLSDPSLDKFDFEVAGELVVHLPGKKLADVEGKEADLIKTLAGVMGLAESDISLDLKQLDGDVALDFHLPQGTMVPAEKAYKFKFAVGEDPKLASLMSGRIFDSYVVEVTGTTEEELDAAHDDWVDAYMQAVGSTGDAYNYDIQWKDMGNGLFEGHFYTTKDYTSTKKQP